MKNKPLVADSYADKQDKATLDSDLPSLADRVASLAAEVDVLRSLRTVLCILDNSGPFSCSTNSNFTPTTSYDNLLTCQGVLQTRIYHLVLDLLI